jgi:hypothetical protein
MALAYSFLPRAQINLINNKKYLDIPPLFDLLSTQQIKIGTRVVLIELVGP